MRKSSLSPSLWTLRLPRGMRHHLRIPILWTRIQRLREVILSRAVWLIWAEVDRCYEASTRLRPFLIPWPQLQAGTHSLGSPASGDRVPGELPRILDSDQDVQEAETVGETQEPKCSGPLSTRPAGIRTPVLVVACNPTATSHPGAAACM